MTEINSETPAKVAAKGRPTASHLDAKGRRITVCSLNAIEYYRFTKGMGASANNPATMDLASIVATVRKIDAIDYALPSSERDVEFLIQQLDFEGIAAAGLALAKLNEGADAEGEAELEAAKN